MVIEEFRDGRYNWVVFPCPSLALDFSVLSVAGLTVVEPKWLAKLGKTLCSYGKPLDHPAPK